MWLLFDYCNQKGANQMISPVEIWTAQKTGLYGNLNPDTLLKWQSEKLESLIHYARNNTRFYKSKLSGNTALTDLPFTTPTDIAEDPFAFLAVSQNNVARLTTLSNSGTTRAQKRVFFTEGDLEKTMDFFEIGMSVMISKGDHAQILISSETKNSLGSLLKKSLSRLGVSADILGEIPNVNTAIEASRKADCIIGMPSEILYMCQTERNLHPKSVLLTADYVPACVIDILKNRWECNVFTHYGHTEFGFGCAVDCEYHNGHHLRDADLIFEIIDPKTGIPVWPGESGEIVLTTLSNEAMPLIRYRTGNISRIINIPCKCGGVLPRLGRIEGRIESNISVGNGKMLSIHQLDELLYAVPSIRGFNASIKQEENKYTLYLTIDAEDKLNLSEIITKLPQDLTIIINYGLADPFLHRGKRRLQTADF